MIVNDLHVMSLEFIFLSELQKIFQNGFRTEYFCLLKSHLLCYIVVERTRESSRANLCNPTLDVSLAKVWPWKLRDIKNNVTISRFILKFRFLESLWAVFIVFFWSVVQRVLHKGFKHGHQFVHVLLAHFSRGWSQDWFIFKLSSALDILFNVGVSSIHRFPNFEHVDLHF